MEYNIFIILSMVAFLAVLGAMYLSQSARRQLREEGLAKENEEIKNVSKHNNKCWRKSVPVLRMIFMMI